MSDVDMGRVSVTLPVETIRQIDVWAAQAGLKRGQFTSAALVIGSRVMARQVLPEQFFTPDVWQSFAQAIGLTVEEAQKAVLVGRPKM